VSEQKMVELFQAALAHHGVEDTVLAVGQFEPRGVSGSMFAGAMIGDEVGRSVGLGAGVLAGRAAGRMASGLPSQVMVGVTQTKVYGLEGHSRRKEPGEILFAVPREGLTAKVHQRVNVRVLELVDEETGSRIELEGNRLPITHSKDVLEVLNESAEQPTS
jgi:hypothetical protein